MIQPAVLQPDTVRAAADSAGGPGTIDRLIAVRSIDEAWTLAGALQADLIAFGLKLLVALAVLALFAIGYRVAAAALHPVFERARLQPDVRHLLLAVAKYTILGFGLILALDQVGVDVTGLLAGLGVLGLALGFAAKDSLANVFAGITILWDRPLRVGDRVEIDGEFGQVKQITLRSTRIHTNDNQVVIIPNQFVVNNKVINHTMLTALRLSVTFGIAYKEDIAAARAAVLPVVDGDDRISREPPAEVVVSSLDESAVTCALRFWLKDPHLEVPLEFAVRERIKLALDSAGIEIPFPHRQLLIERPPGEAPEAIP